MKKQYKLGVIGSGETVNAILKGAVLSDFIRPKKIIVNAVTEEDTENAQDLGLHITDDNRYIAENSEFLLVAVNPANFEDTVKSLEGFKPEKVISVMAGVKKNTIKNLLGVGLIKVARSVLNAPSVIGSGSICLDMTDFNKSTDDTEFIYGLFANLGIVVSVDESKLHASAALSDGGTASVFMFIQSLIEAGVKQGLPKGEAKIIAVQTVLGCAEMVQREENSVDELLINSCGKNGGGIEAVKVLEDGGFRRIVCNAIDASAARTEDVSDK